MMRGSWLYMTRFLRLWCMMVRSSQLSVTWGKGGGWEPDEDGWIQFKKCNGEERGCRERENDFRKADTYSALGYMVQKANWFRHWDVWQSETINLLPNHPISPNRAFILQQSVLGAFIAVAKFKVLNQLWKLIRFLSTARFCVSVTKVLISIE